MRAFKLYTGADNASHVLEGTIDEKDRTDLVAIHFKETTARHLISQWRSGAYPSFVGKASMICSVGRRLLTRYFQFNHGRPFCWIL